MTIRAKLYAAIVLTVLGPLATTAVALHGMSQMGDRFDQVHERAEHESLARELKFQVTDMNGWQTAYGYAGGPLRRRVRGVRGCAPAPARPGVAHADRGARASAGHQLQDEFDSFMQLDAVAWRELRTGNPDRTKDILLGPELKRFEAMAATAEQLAGYEASRATETAVAFDDARDEARKRLVAVALGAGVVILLLLVTANDIARMALEGERNVRARPSRESEGDGSS